MHQSNLKKFFEIQETYMYDRSTYNYIEAVLVRLKCELATVCFCHGLDKETKHTHMQENMCVCIIHPKLVFVFPYKWGQLCPLARITSLSYRVLCIKNGLFYNPDACSLFTSILMLCIFFKKRLGDLAT